MDTENVLLEASKDAQVAAIPTEEKLTKLGELSAAYLTMKSEIEDMELALELKKKEFNKLQGITIPELLLSTGLSEFRLKNGLKVAVKRFYTGKIDEERQKEAFDWLVSINEGDIVKNTVSVSLRRDGNGDEILEALRDFLVSKNIMEFTEKEGIHHNSLSSWIKERIESGKFLDRELFGVFTGYKTTIK